MSAQTSIYQAEHTSEPWSAQHCIGDGTDPRARILDHTGYPIHCELRCGLQMTDGPQGMERNGRWDTVRANARRIVACVNACTGIPTEALEGGVVADLLAACKAVLAKLDSITTEEFRAGGEREQREALSVVVAKVEGK